MFEHLPAEVVLEIAGYLGSCRDTNAFLLVNRRLHLLLDDELYLRNIRRQNSSGLIWVAEHNQLNTVHRFLSLGANPNAVNRVALSRRITPLHAAAREGHLLMVKLLLDHGADPRSEDSFTKTPFCDALCAGHECITRHLASQTPNFPSFLAIRHMALSPIHVAARLHEDHTIRWLIEAGQDINKRNAQGKTALHFVLAPASGLRGDETLRVVMALINMGALAARERGLAGPEPLVRCCFEHISCRCGIAVMTRFLRQRETSKNAPAWHSADSVTRARVTLLGPAI